MHIIDVGISEKDKYKIATLKEIKNFKIKYYIPNIEQYKNWFGKMYNKAHFSYSMFARLSIPNLIEEDKILYLDCDIIVNKSLNELFNTDISDYHCAVARRHKITDELERDKQLLELRASVLEAEEERLSGQPTMSISEARIALDKRRD